MQSRNSFKSFFPYAATIFLVGLVSFCVVWGFYVFFESLYLMTGVVAFSNTTIIRLPAVLIMWFKIVPEISTNEQALSWFIVTCPFIALLCLWAWDGRLLSWILDFVKTNKGGL